MDQVLVSLRCYCSFIETTLFYQMNQTQSLGTLSSDNGEKLLEEITTDILSQ